MGAVCERCSRHDNCCRISCHHRPGQFSACPSQLLWVCDLWWGLQVHVRVKIPSQPTKEEKDLVEQLRELEGKKKDGGGFFGKFKL